jgi:alpha-galactosidase
VGGNLNKWTPEEMEAAAKYVGYYKQVRATVQRGSLYRLIAPEGSEVSATEYVSQGTAVLFAFLHSQQFGTPFPTVFLRGLDEGAMYKVQAIDPAQLTETENLSGAYLMHHGIDLKLRGDYDSTSVILEKLP